MGFIVDNWREFKRSQRDKRLAGHLVDFQRQLSAISRRLSRSRKLPEWAGLPFNGQRLRQEAVESLIANFKPDALIETGTFMGDTTRYLAENGLPVYATEIKLSFRMMTRLSVRNYSNVEVLPMDSRVAIKKLNERRVARPFAYLDAHWWKDLPLMEEIRLLTSLWNDAVIVIDDIQVPGDDGYLFDDFQGKAVSIELLELPDSVSTAYPCPPSSKETGARSGTLYVGHGPDGIRAIEAAIAAGDLRRA